MLGGLLQMLGFPKPSLPFRRFVHPEILDAGWRDGLSVTECSGPSLGLASCGLHGLPQGFRAASFVQKGVVQSCAIIKAIPWIDRRGVDT